MQSECKSNRTEHLTSLIMQQRSHPRDNTPQHSAEGVGCFPDCTGVIFWTQTDKMLAM